MGLGQVAQDDPGAAVSKTPPPRPQIAALYQPPASPSGNDENEFVSLEDSRKIVVETAHRTIVALSALPVLSAAGAALLKTLVEIVNAAEELEIKKYVVMHKNGAGRPDPERAANIAAGTIPSDPLTKKDGS